MCQDVSKARREKVSNGNSYFLNELFIQKITSSTKKKIYSYTYLYYIEIYVEMYNLKME